MEKIGVLGLGYVGLPLAQSLSATYEVTGIEIDLDKYKKLSLEIKNFEIVNSIENTNNINIFIVTVPTPINLDKSPDLSFIKKATKDIGSQLQGGEIIIYESTVYPGTTEDICVPILEEISGGKLNIDFFIAFSPERIDPGNEKNTLANTDKLYATSHLDIDTRVRNLYENVITDASVIKVNGIKECEAAKLLENVQRDVNIALINEYASVMKLLSIDIYEVINAAATKWNFQKFLPGLVGGHCIGVDPYYFLYLEKKLSLPPGMIRASRNINNYKSLEIIETIITCQKEINANRIIILGLTFKPNIDDTRNSQAIEVLSVLKKSDVDVIGYDQHFDSTKHTSIPATSVMPKFKEKDIIFELVEHNYHNECLSIKNILSEGLSVTFKDLMRYSSNQILLNLKNKSKH